MLHSITTTGAVVITVVSDLRLVTADSNTVDISAGRVEILINGIWAPICRDHAFDDDDAFVICRQLGFSDFISYNYAEELGLGVT